MWRMWRRMVRGEMWRRKNRIWRRKMRMRKRRIRRNRWRKMRRKWRSICSFFLIFVSDGSF